MISIRSKLTTLFFFSSAPDNRGNPMPTDPALLSPNLAQQSTPILKRLAALYQRGKRKGGANAAGKDNSRGERCEAMLR